MLASSRVSNHYIVIILVCTALLTGVLLVSSVEATEPAQTAVSESTLPTVTDGTSISYGANFTESLSTSDEYDESFNGYHDEYTFYGSKGDQATIEVRPTDGIWSERHHAHIDLYGPDGEHLDDTYGGQGAVDLTHTLPEDGTYTVLVTTRDAAGSDVYPDEEASTTDTFEYQFRLYEDFGDAEDVGYGDTLDRELSETDNYRDDRQGYYDAYSFTGEKGDSITVETRPEGGIWSERHHAHIDLYGPDGEHLDDTYGGQGAVDLTHTLPEDGTYTVLVTTRDAAGSDVYPDEEASTTDTFEYQFRLYEDFGDAEDVGYGDTLDRELSETDNYRDDRTGYYDTYVFSGKKDDTIEIHAIPGDSSDSPQHHAHIDLYGPDGEHLDDTYGGQGAVDLTHTLPEDGTYTVLVTTRDAAGSDVYPDEEASTTDTFEYRFNLSGPGNNPPIVRAEASTERVPVGQTVRLNASGTTDPNGDPITFNWTQERGVIADPIVDINGDDTATATFVAPEVSDIETFEFILTVTDNRGDTQTKIVEVVVDPRLSTPDESAPPVAAFNHSPRNPATSETVTFNASLAGDPDGSVRSYEWEFDDGETSSGEVVTHSYDSPGTYNVTLTVTDMWGNEATETQRVVTEDTVPPTAVTGEDRTVSIGASVSFDATASSDNVDIEGYTWDLGNEDQITGESPSYSFDEPGTYDVVLTVVDSAGNEDTDTVRITVEDRTSPVADAGGNRTVSLEESVSFDASNSSDNVAINRYEWDFDDGETATGVSPTHTFSDPGMYEVTLTVTDESGATSTDEVTIVVNAPPEANITTDTPDPEIGTEIALDAGSSSDPDGALASYEWDVDGDGEFEESGETITQTFDSAGQYTVVLKVTDENGATDKTEVTITVQQETETTETTADADGDDRSTTVPSSESEQDPSDSGGSSGMGLLSAIVAISILGIGMLNRQNRVFDSD